MEPTLTKQPNEDVTSDLSNDVSTDVSADASSEEGMPIPADLKLDRANEPGGGTLLPIILESLDDDKAQDVINLDLRGKTSITDDMVICSGRSQRHVGALADHILRKVKQAGYGRARVEGLPHCDWVLIDVGDIIVHIFRPEVRDFYKLERMWSVELPSEQAV